MPVEIARIKRCKECGKDFIWKKDNPMLCPDCMDKLYCDDENVVLNEK